MCRQWVHGMCPPQRVTARLADSDMVYLALLLELDQGLHRHLDWHAAVDAVNVVKVDIGYTKSTERGLGTLDDAREGERFIGRGNM